MYGLVMFVVALLIVGWSGYTLFRIVQKNKAEKLAREEELYGSDDDYEDD